MANNNDNLAEPGIITSGIDISGNDAMRNSFKSGMDRTRLRQQVSDLLGDKPYANEAGLRIPQVNNGSVPAAGGLRGIQSLMGITANADSKAAQSALESPLTRQLEQLKQNALSAARMKAQGVLGGSGIIGFTNGFSRPLQPFIDRGGTTGLPGAATQTAQGADAALSDAVKNAAQELRAQLPDIVQTANPVSGARQPTYSYNGINIAIPDDVDTDDAKAVSDAVKDLNAMADVMSSFADMEA